MTGCEVLTELSEFKVRADATITNRRVPELADVVEKLYTRSFLGWIRASGSGFRHQPFLQTHICGILQLC